MSVTTTMMLQIHCRPKSAEMIADDELPVMEVDERKVPSLIDYYRPPSPIQLARMAPPTRVHQPWKNDGEANGEQQWEAVPRISDHDLPIGMGMPSRINPPEPIEGIIFSMGSPTRLDPPKPERNDVPDAENGGETVNGATATSCGRVKYWFYRFRGFLDIPLAFVFGIILYLMDVCSDIMAGVHHFQNDHPVWGSLAITFVILPSLCWAAVSWSWWYYDRKAAFASDATKREERKRRRITRMKLAVLLLDPLVT